jgi:uncharacterized phage protein (TIGR01671 family)
MERKIKFRAWNTPNELMYQDVQNGILAENEKGQLVLGVSLGKLSKDSGSILMQFTGLVDKNAVDIYEGDIVTFKRSVGNWTGQYITTTHKIIFSEEVFAFVMEYGSQYIKLRKHWGYEYEVIGNVYENKSLLIETATKEKGL